MDHFPYIFTGFTLCIIGVALVLFGIANATPAEKTGSLTPGPPPKSEENKEYINGFMDGKNSYFIDSWAVRQYHDELEWMLEQNTKSGKEFGSVDAAKLWREIIKGAEAWENFYQERTDDQRRTEYDDPARAPFWKREVGTPRSLTRTLSQVEYEAYCTVKPDDPGPVTASITDSGEGEQRVFGVGLRRRDESE